MNVSLDQAMITVGSRKFTYVPFAEEEGDPCYYCDLKREICGIVGDVPCCSWERRDKTTGIWKEVEQ